MTNYTSQQFHTSQIVHMTESARINRQVSFCTFTAAMCLFGCTVLPSHPITKVSMMVIACGLSGASIRLDKLQEKVLQPYNDISHQESIKKYRGWIDYAMEPPRKEVAVLESPQFNPTHPVLIALNNHKLECSLAGELKSPSFVRTLVKPNNCTAAKLLGIGKELQLDLALDSAPIISISKGAIAIDTPRSDRQIARFADYWKPSQKFEAAIGVDINNKLLSIDLSHPETCHILGAGTTGSGKSVWLQSLLLSLLIGRSPEQLLVAICDPKRVSFFAFKNCANLLVPVISDPDEVIQVGNYLIAEMEKRYQLFAECEVENIDQYNAIADKKLPRILFLMDEYGDLKSACNKKRSEQIENINIRIGEKARASGIAQAVITQRALNVITPRIRANCPARVLLKVAEDRDTECILGKVPFDGRDLLGRGDLFFNGDRLQSLLCESSDFGKLTKGAPMYQLEDLDCKQDRQAIIKSLKKTDTQLSQISEPLQKIIDYLGDRDWTRDNAIKQGIAIFKTEQTPISELQGYLQFLELQGYLETRGAGRNGLEARVKTDD